MTDIKIVARPWQPQDLIDDLQMIIDEECDNYLNTRRTTLCMAMDYLKEHFAEQGWIPVRERLPKLIPCNAGTAYSEAVNVLTSGRKVLTAIWDGSDFIADAEFWEAEGEEITHWTPVLLPLPEPPKGE